MEDLKVGITDKNGELAGFRIDGEIVTGLFLTINPEKIKDNCEDFEINFNDKNSNISKRSNVSIFTIKFKEDNLIQYLIAEDLSLTELNKLTPKQMPSEIKDGILQGYELTKINNLGDLL